MKFTKTAVALAIAGIAAAPFAQADTTLSGAVQLKLQGTDADDDSGDANIGAGDVLLGIVTEHELNSGLTGYGSLRLDMDREIPLAVEYGQVANDLFDVGGEINGGISYTGSFGPVGLIANFSPEPNSDAVGVGAKFGIGGFSIGLGFEDRGFATSDESGANMAVGASFGLAGASVAAHFWSKENDGANADDTESVALKVGYGFGGVSAGLTFATQETGSAEEEKIRLDLGYGLGGGMEVSTRITASSDNDDMTEDLTEWRIQLAKSF